MIFQEPKVEFIELQLGDTISTSNQSQLGQCGTNDEDCYGGAEWNY